MLEAARRLLRSGALPASGGVPAAFDASPEEMGTAAVKTARTA